MHPFKCKMAREPCDFVYELAARLPRTQRIPTPSDSNKRRCNPMSCGGLILFLREAVPTMYEDNGDSQFIVKTLTHDVQLTFNVG